MSESRQPTNPFYVALVIAGIAFSMTACAYTVMAFRSTSVAAPESAEGSGAGLIYFLDHHGGKLMAIELVLLGIATAGAIGTDQYWNRTRAAAQPSSSQRRDREP